MTTRWFSVNPNTRLDYVVALQQTEIGLFDALFSVAGLGSEYEQGYYSFNLPTREIPYKNKF